MGGAPARTYDRQQCVFFRKTDGRFGGLSNMAPGFPLRVNGVLVRTSEALYQACRFPHLPDVQRLIIDEASPMTAKMKSKPYRPQSRPDWGVVRVTVMRWCLRVKLAQHWDKFGRLLLTTGDQPIVEDSRKDDFWGAKPQDNGKLIGGNVLGRLLMELREQLRGADSSALMRVEPPAVPDFLLYERPIEMIEIRLGSGLADAPRDLFTVREVEAPALASSAVSITPTPVPTGSPEPRPHAGENKSIDAKRIMRAEPRRLIEVDLPIRKISDHARREKSIRHGHISTLHIWWARRPVAACRAVLLASLLPDPSDTRCPDEFRRAAARSLTDMQSRRGGAPRNWADPFELREALLEFIADFANWDLAGDEDYLRTSRDLVRAAHVALGGDPDQLPNVVDPFAGGGAIPLEALRVGANAYASDLNPVPVLLNKVVLEFAPRHGLRLANAVRELGTEIGRSVATELSHFYPRSDGTPIAYFWARTILSEAPDSDPAPIEIPLLRSMWLSKKKGRKFALRWVRDSSGRIVLTERAVRYCDGTERTVRQPSIEVFAPKSDRELEVGTSKAGAATCPVTKFTTPVESVRAQLARRRGGASDARLVAVAFSRDGEGRFYRAPTADDEGAFRLASQEFELRSAQAAQAGESLLPDGKLNHLRGFFNIVLYGMQTWGDLFSTRQGLALTTFVRVLAERSESLSREANDPHFSLAVQTCLALALDRLAEKLTSVARWDTSRENPQGTFGRQALPMVWDFCEVNPFSGSGGDWDTALSWVVRVLESTALAMRDAPGIGHVEQASATEHPLPDDSAAAVFTDPPYYAAVPYADLSDFFYSWLRRTVGTRYPALFSAALSPKDDELVSLAHRAAMYRNKDGRWFEERMEKACAEARRVCQPSGIGVFVFASKDTPAWEAMLSALVRAGWVVTASWPIDTEMGSRLRARNSATLASSIHIVCRPRETPEGELQENSVANWRDVLSELPLRIHDWLPRLAKEGVVGADAIFACLGPALEVFTRFARVEKVSGELVLLREYLEQVWAAVAREALSMLFSSVDASGLEEDARLTAMWLWTLVGPNTPNGVQEAPQIASAEAESEDGSEADDDDGNYAPAQTGFVLEFDAARKIAQGLGARLEGLSHVIEIKGDKARLLGVAERTSHLFAKAEGKPSAKRYIGKKQMTLFAELEEAAETQGWGDSGAPLAGTTSLDRVHQAMLLFGAGRSEALKRFILEEGVGKQPQFWKLAQSLSALYPVGSDEKRWVDGVLSRKKGLGFG